MDSKKVINVGVTSSLIDLKAELLRKKQQLSASTSRDARGGALKTTKRSDILSSKHKDNQKNKGVDQRSIKDKIKAAEEEQSLQKSQTKLEAKARLYEKMQKGALLLDNGDDDEDEEEFSATKTLFSQSLVNFQQKAIDEIQEKRRKLEDVSLPAGPEPQEGEEEPYQVDEGEWVEFTDHLGRTRKCLKADLPSFLERDEELSRPENPGICLSASADDRMREIKRQKWDLESEILAAKEKVHYQDVLFDEVRSHGAGYYAFSKDEATRQQQMNELRKLSEQTEANRGKIKKEKNQKEDMLKARLRKIKNRKRAKAGLPPLPDDEDDDEEEEDEKGEEREEKKEEDDDKKSDEATAAATPARREIRAWDVGKAGVFGPKPSTFDELDEKWLKDRRSDRNPEFAPPSNVYSNGGLRKNYPSSTSSMSSFSSSSKDKYSNFVKSKDSLPSTSKSQPVIVEPMPKPFQPPQTFWKQSKAQSSHPPPQKPIPIKDELPAPVPESSREFDRGRGGTEIAPPPTFEYYHGDQRKKSQPVPKTDATEMLDAVSTGLKALREKWETKKSPKDRVHMNFM